MTADKAASKALVRAWSRAQSRIGRRQAMPVILLGLVNTGLAIGQAWCIASLLARALAWSVAAHAARSDVAHAAQPGGFAVATGSGWTLLAVFGLLAVFRAVLLVQQDLWAARTASGARRRLRGEALSAILSCGPALLRRETGGTLTALVVDRIEALDGFFGRWIPAASLAVASPALVLAVAGVVQPRAALVLLGCGLAVPVSQAVFGIGAAVAARQQFTAMARLQSRFLDRIRGIATIVLAGRAADEALRLGAAADELRRRTMRVLRVAFLSSAALDCAFAVALVSIVLLDGHALLAGTTATSAPGAALLRRSLFALVLVPEFFAPLRAFALAYQDRMQAAGAAEALDTLGGAPAAPPPPAPGPVAIRTVAAHGVTVAFERVGFTWDAGRGPVLTDVSFRIPARETVVLVGPSGSGKSTLIEMLLGFVSPDEGRITLNGADLSTIVPSALSQMTGWIGQRPLLFAGSIRENVLFARPDASEAELSAALRAAAVDGFAATLPDGLDTFVGEGGHGLSGGQAQRVAIARAFLRNAPLLLLDEPTAHLDPVTEREILDSLKRLAVGRTVLLASHSSAVHAFPGRRIHLSRGQVVQAEGAVSA